MKKYILLTLAVILVGFSPAVVSARGATPISVEPTASIKIGGVDSQTVLTGQRIPNIVWRSTNGKSFQTRLLVNNSSLCNGLTNNQLWGQGRTANGNFSLGNAPKVREGCVMTFVYEVTSATGKKATDRIVLRYTAPAKTTLAPTITSLTPVVISNTPIVGTKDSPTLNVTAEAVDDNIIVKWGATNLAAHTEFLIGLERADKSPTKGSLTRASNDKRSAGIMIGSYTPAGKYIAVVYVVNQGSVDASNGLRFESKPFDVLATQYNSNVDDSMINNERVTIKNPNGSTFTKPGDNIRVEWVTRNVNDSDRFDKEFDVSLVSSKDGRVYSSERVNLANRAHNIVIPSNAPYSAYRIMIQIKYVGEVIFKEAPTFYSEEFSVTNLSSGAGTSPQGPVYPVLTNTEKLKAVENVFGKNSELYRIVQLLMTLGII